MKILLFLGMHDDILTFLFYLKKHFIAFDRIHVSLCCEKINSMGIWHNRNIAADGKLINTVPKLSLFTSAFCNWSLRVAWDQYYKILIPGVADINSVLTTNGLFFFWISWRLWSTWRSIYTLIKNSYLLLSVYCLKRVQGECVLYSWAPRNVTLLRSWWRYMFHVAM